ncbi:hypothetical protein SFUMM280S_01469 [Streptomyces fumanus]
MDALRGPGTSLGGEVAQRGVGRAQPGRVRQQRGHRVDRLLQPLGHPGHQLRQRPVPEGHRGQRAGQRGVHLGRGPAQRPCLGGEVLALGQFAQGEFPAVGGALHIGLEDTQHPGLPGQFRRHPRGRGGDARAALAGERQRQFEVGVDAGHDPAQQLQDERISVDDRGVGLLGGHQAGDQAVADLLVGGPVEAESADPGAGAQRLQQDLGGPGVVQGVVDRAAGQRALGHVSDERGRQPGRQRLAHAYQELVAVARPLGGARYGGELLVGADDEVVQAQPGVGREQFGGGDQGEAGDRAALAGEPALAGQPLAQQGVERREQAGRRGQGAGGGFRHGGASFSRMVGG